MVKERWREVDRAGHLCCGVALRYAVQNSTEQ